VFENIEQLEKQVEEFQQNILSSTEFLKGIENLTTIIKKQQIDFDTNSKELLKEMEENNKRLEESLSEHIAVEFEKLGKNNETLVSNLKQSIKEYEGKMSKLLDDANRKNVELSEKTILEIKDINQQYAEKLETESQLIKEMTGQLENKYELFVKKLESTNVDQLFVSFQDMKKSLETKMLIIIVGVVISIITVIFSIFIK
jgi:hypothetical protein